MKWKSGQAGWVSVSGSWTITKTIGRFGNEVWSLKAPGRIVGEYARLKDAKSEAEHIEMRGDDGPR